MELPFQELYGHVCAVDQNRLFVIGGRFHDEVHDTIHEIQLTPPFGLGLLSNMRRPICYHGAVRIGSKIYIIGGMDGHATHNNVLVFDPRANEYEELNPLPYTVSRMATVVWRDNVVVLGGKDNEGNVHNTVILYNVTTQTHRMLPVMKKKRYGCTAVTIGDDIIVMGGLDENGAPLNSVECYNFNANVWRELPAMTEARAFATAVRCNISLP